MAVSWEIHAARFSRASPATCRKSIGFFRFRLRKRTFRWMWLKVGSVPKAVIPRV